MIGRILGKRYEITEKIAQGGMSIVYKALDLNLNRYDAVKVLKEEFASNKEILERFKQEANAVAFLSHPNIVNIYNVGSEENIHYIVMEFVKGLTLKEVIRSKGMIPNEMLLNYSYQIARALECAHNNNIIHRDIKPHNIIVTKDDLVKVTDFGIAKHSDSATITNSGKIIGSAHYFSPEQARGNLTDRRSDIYSLGIVMYEMATGVVPFDAESPITIALKHMQEPLPSPKLINKKLTDGIEKVIIKATEKNPIDRYQRIEDMMMDLRTLMAGERLPIMPAENNNGNTQIMGAVIPEKMNMNDDIFDDEKPSDHKKRNLIIGLAMILVIVGGALLGNYVFGKINNTPPDQVVTDEVTIPTLVGKSKATAEAELKLLGLTLEVQSTESSTEPVDTILRSVPEVGAVVKKNTSVAVVLSAGEVKLFVPSITGGTQEAANTILMNNGLILGEVKEEFSETIPLGEIISQDPLVNTSVPQGRAVNIVISKGPEVTISKVPALVGKTEREAQALLESVKLQIGTVTKVPTGEEALVGRIASQNIPADTELKQDSKINIEVYELKTVQIPTSLIGMKVSDAVKQLKSLGFVPTLEADTKNGDLVLDLNPGAGSNVPYGSTVEITGEVEPEPEPDPIVVPPATPAP